MGLKLKKATLFYKTLKVEEIKLYSFCLVIESLINILSSKTTVLLLRSSSIPPLFRNCCTILALPISSEMVDGF